MLLEREHTRRLIDPVHFGELAFEHEFHGRQVPKVTLRVRMDGAGTRIERLTVGKVSEKLGYGKAEFG
eukprot:4073205-Pleurochrysis_carterae.AAC.2